MEDFATFYYPGSEKQHIYYDGKIYYQEKYNSFIRLEHIDKDYIRFVMEKKKYSYDNKYREIYDILMDGKVIMTKSDYDLVLYYFQVDGIPVIYDYGEFRVLEDMFEIVSSIIIDFSYETIEDILEEIIKYKENHEMIYK